MVDKAGSGMWADVHFCVSNNFVTSTKALKSNAAGPSNLTRYVQAVKVSKSRGHGSIAAEVAILKAIQQVQPNFEGNVPFFKLLSWDTVDPIPRWLATSTLPL